MPVGCACCRLGAAILRGGPLRGGPGAQAGGPGPGVEGGPVGVGGPGGSAGPQPDRVLDLRARLHGGSGGWWRWQADMPRWRRFVS